MALYAPPGGRPGEGYFGGMSGTLAVRAAAVSGTFYPGEAGALSDRIEALFAQAPGAWSRLPKALIVPHAGYDYSGSVAARAYAPLARRRGPIRRVVALGPTHYLPVAGVALPGARAFETPLGRVPVDEEAVERIRSLPQVLTSPVAHAREHALEVQLPFLQRALGDFQWVPLAVGQVPPEDVEEVLEALWGGPETLVVVSSDLSHYLPYASAQEVDRRTCASIGALEPLTGHDRACGATPVNALLALARRRRLSPRLLDLRNSGDAGGDRGRVVGYGAFAFTEDSDGTADLP